MSEAFEDIVQRIGNLTPVERQDLLARLASELNPPSPRRSILELQGLGKEVWKGVDVADYLNRERESWSR